MFFMVSRTSLSNEDEQPCEEATQRKYDYVDVRTLHSFEEFEKKFGESWLLKGINHCINEKGYIQRTFPDDDTDWFVEINSLEELMSFNKKYGRIVIKEACYSNPNIAEIEIYDDYRE